MLDLLFFVDDPISWHTANLAINPTHYAAHMARLGPRAIDWASRSIGCGVYFNTMVDITDDYTMQTRRIKYGVTATDMAIQDLLHWTSLYIAGRFQKPVLPLIEDKRVCQAQTHNLANAVRAAYNCIGGIHGMQASETINGEATGCVHETRTFSINQLFHAICALSYTGDIRVGIAEDDHKIRRIVHGMQDQLLHMYAPSLQQQLDEGTIAIRAIDDTHVYNGIDALRKHPQTAQIRLMSHATVPEDTRALLRATVRRSSARQAALGLVSAGPVKAARYVYEKMRKKFGR